jgi:hypothetical protein
MIARPEVLALAQKIAEEIAKQKCGGIVDLGDCESVVFVGASPILNLVEIAEAIQVDIDALIREQARLNAELIEALNREIELHTNMIERS